MNLDEYNYLWTTEKEKHVLVKLEAESFAIFDKSINSALIIEDNEVFKQVINEMLRNGNEIIDKETFRDLLKRKK